MLKQRGAPLYGNACEPSSVKPSASFMYLDKGDTTTAANKGSVWCLCGFVRTLHTFVYDNSMIFWIFKLLHTAYGLNC